MKTSKLWLYKCTIATLIAFVFLIASLFERFLSGAPLNGIGTYVDGYQLWLASLVAIVFGWLAWKKERHSSVGAVGVALGGLIFSILVGLFVLFCALVIWVFFQVGIG